MRFENKVVIVTGAAGGIGAATARRFGAEGARLVLADYDEAGVNSAADALRQGGVHDVLALRCDVGAESDVAAAVEVACARFGRLDVVVNNAGVMIFKPIEAHTEDDLLRVLKVDLGGAFWFTKHAFLRCAPGSAIVLIAAERVSDSSAAFAAA